MKKTVFALIASTFAFSVSHAASFNEVRSVLLNPPTSSSDAVTQEELAVYASGTLPHYETTTASFFRNGVNILKEAAIQTVNDHSDYFPRLEKLIHSNGICFTGKWKIDAENPYTGYFQKNSTAPVIVRVSTATSNTETGSKRGFGLAVKLFPTQDPNESVTTANFFTVDILTGAKTKHFMETSVTNEPKVGFEFSLIKMMVVLAKSLSAADKNPLFRPLYEVSEAGLAAGAQAKTPHWIQIKPAAGQPLVNEKDFRNELDMKNYPHGLKFDILVSDTTKETKTDAGWSRIGGIELNESIVSYGCDRQLHFHHPKLK